MVYTGTVMTENVFYPLFLLVVLALVAVLERPTLATAGAVLALVVVAYLTRAQSLAFVPAILVAPLLLAFFERRPLRLGAAAVRGHLRDRRRRRRLCSSSSRSRAASSLRELLGAYSVVEPPALQRPPDRRLRALARRRPLPLPGRDPARRVDHPRRPRAPGDAAGAGVPRGARSRWRSRSRSSSPRSRLGSRRTGSTSATSSSWRRSC